MDQDQEQIPDASVVNYRSPGSFMGASIQSHQVSSFEIDEASSAGATSKKVNPTWRLGMPWFEGSSASSPREFDSTEAGRYYGGLMKAEEAVRPKKNIRKSFFRSEKRCGRHADLKRMGADDESSIGDFSKSEWTPQDSAYGAAFPVCGCIPKRVRRLIEFSLIGFMVIGFVWIVIAASIHVTNSRTKDINNSTEGSSYNGQMIAVDDDYYVDITNDDVNARVVNYDDVAIYYVDDAYQQIDDKYLDDQYQQMDDQYIDDTSYQYSNGYDDDAVGRRWR